MSGVNNVGSSNGGANWWENGSAGFLERQRSLGTWGRFGPPGRNQAATSPGFQTQLVGIRAAAEGLRSSVRDMQGLDRNQNSPFMVNVPTSADAEIMTVSGFDANRMRIASVSDFSVDIVQLAQTQRNEGITMTAAASATSQGFSQGNNQISITMGGRQFDINFNVSATDTVRDVQQRIANMVNSRSDIDVRASVSTVGGNSTLAFESANTGSGGEFSVSGNATDILGMDGIPTQVAQDAEFRVNRGNFTGALQTSSTNNVDFGNGVTATLRDLGQVDVTLERDTTGQINAMRNMVNQFNDLMDYARRNRGSSSASRLEENLHNFFMSNAPALGRAGIGMNENGFLRINESGMRSAAESGGLEQLARNGGPLNRLERIADNVVRNPSDFVHTNDVREQFNFTSAQTNRLNAVSNMGMLFDSFF